jgi:phosphonopyruvate decarboxylase
MLHAQDLHEALRQAGIERFCGVPDSTLSDFTWYLTDRMPAVRHRVCPNEGNAIALAAGHWLGTGRMTCVYMQNSGLGNAVNPLASLADPEVYGIPMLLVVGWRGVPGQKDEPQHVKQGRITLGQLDLLEVPYEILPSEAESAAASVERMTTAALARQGPAALVVRPKTFAPNDPELHTPQAAPMSREDAIRTLVESIGNAAVIVSTTGKASRELYEQRRAFGPVAHEPIGATDFLTVGSMGHASHIALGLAETRPERRVVCLDGDGAVLMHMGALAMIGAAAPPNLLHLVIRNGTHDSVGGLPTCGDTADMPALAKACGYQGAERVASCEQLQSRLPALLEAVGPTLLEIVVRPGARADLGRPRETPRENRKRFVAGLGGPEIASIASQ